ncbi:MAG: 2-hydroxyacyl-CoA dehydratase [Planctomycetes bacterium]|nr:2-hydroxyacyl-CoA dehydratase [Planctomycetota bacterium]
MMDALEEIVASCGRTSVAEDVAAWKARTGGKAVGCFPVGVPEEILHAAGVLPVGITGGAVTTQRADSGVPTFTCSLARGTIERGLDGDLSILDGMIFPDACDVARNLEGIWRENSPGRISEVVRLPRNPQSKHAHAFLESEFERLRTTVGEMSGRDAKDKDLRSSIQAYNRNRALIRELSRIRGEQPWRLRATESFLLVRAGRSVPVEEHNALLESAARAIEMSGRRRRDGVRVVIEGAPCEPPPAGLIETLEEAGCLVVEDDFLAGRRRFGADVEATGSPLSALVRAVLRDVPPSGPRRAEGLIEKVRRTGARGVVFCVAKFCEPELLDLPLLRAAVERGRIPHLTFEVDGGMGVFESVREQVEAFVEPPVFFP